MRFLFGFMLGIAAGFSLDHIHGEPAAHGAPRPLLSTPNLGRVSRRNHFAKKQVDETAIQLRSGRALEPRMCLFAIGARSMRPLGRDSDEGVATARMRDSSGMSSPSRPSG